MAPIDAYRDWWRPDFFAAMKLVAAIGDALARQDESRPVLVDDTAVEFYSRSQIPASTIDLLIFDPLPGSPDIEAELPRHGFVRDAGAGPDCWAHPSTRLPFRLVGSAASIPLGSYRFCDNMLATIGVHVIGLEDAIAFLVRRWWSDDSRGDEALDQAATLYLCWRVPGQGWFDQGNYEVEYLDWRLLDQTGHRCGWALLEEAADRKLRHLPMPAKPDRTAPPRRLPADPAAAAVSTTLENVRRIMETRLGRAPDDDRHS